MNFFISSSRGGTGRSLVLLLGLFLFALWFGGGDPNGHQLPDVSLQPFSEQANWPLAFVPNVGQTAVPVQFQVQGEEGMLFFTNEGVSFVLPRENETAMLQLQFQGANLQPAIRGGEQMVGKVNYIKGNDPTAWHTAVPTYAAIFYEALYPGIDWVVDGRTGILKGSYMVAPGADPDLIRWQYQGASNVTIDDKTGYLIVTLPNDNGMLIESTPTAW